jgi:hypothetical protein
MHYPFEVKPQESCLTQLYAFPGGSQEDKTSAGIGTTVRHPPRERIETVKIEKIRSALPREGVAALPYTDISNY